MGYSEIMSTGQEGQGYVGYDGVWAHSGSGGLESKQKNALDLCRNNVFTNIGDMWDGVVHTERGTPAEKVVSM